MECSTVDTPIVVDADIAADLEDSEVQEHQGIIIKDLSTQGSPITIVVPSKLVICGNLEQLMLLELREVVNAELVGAFLRQGLNVLGAVVMPEPLVRVKRVCEDGA